MDDDLDSLEENEQSSKETTPLMTILSCTRLGRYGTDFGIGYFDCIFTLITRLVYGNCSI